jgi:enoyl-CoA hydratase/carnithine racemase
MAIITTVNGPFLEIIIDRPEAMNALDARANAELGRIWQRLRDDSALHVAILTGAGDKAFCSGADLKTLIPAYHKGAVEGSDIGWDFGGGLARGLEVDKPIIAAVNGHCLAGGLEMALACDIRICAPNATFALSEVKWAIIPGAGGTQRLPRSIPLGMALEMILTGDPIGATEALRLGLVNRILPLEELMPAARDLAERIASRGPLAVRAAKRAVFGGLHSGFTGGMDLERRLFREVATSEDASEGPRAFAEKRKPRYKGC